MKKVALALASILFSAQGALAAETLTCDGYDVNSHGDLILTTIEVVQDGQHVEVVGRPDVFVDLQKKGDEVTVTVWWSEQSGGSVYSCR